MNEPVTYILVPYSVIIKETGIQTEKETGINILLDAIEIDMPAILNCIRQFNYNYIYSLSGEILNNSDINILLARLYTLFTLSACFRRGNNKIPVFSYTPGEHILNLHIIKDYFILQGEQDIDFTVFEPDKTQVKNDTLFLDIGQLSTFDAYKLAQFRVQEIGQVILAVNNSAPLTGTIASVKALSNENQYIKTLFQTAAVKNNEHWLLHQTKLWQKRASLYLSFIALGKEVGEKEYYEIRQWYHQEYEILPLWFKRLGHIVKVLTGKRTFKSLFSDNVKRNKE
ncbi:hypothetical protein [Longitalea luteola]|uniref:hypothetical protein n=1 Tax=Longitalea luteola TaxID=2812563 RepID=UPI001A95ABFD|nr:hypothetical protein [Longitalea luteola]